MTPSEANNVLDNPIHASRMGGDYEQMKRHLRQMLFDELCAAPVPAMSFKEFNAAIASSVYTEDGVIFHIGLPPAPCAWQDDVHKRQVQALQLRGIQLRTLRTFHTRGKP